MNKRNATASWSGYLHQGKIGILLALIKINKLLDEENNLEGWKVEFESAEDIDIKYNEKVDSRHQVKANKDGTYPNDYKDVLLKRKTINKDGKEKIIRPGFEIFYKESGKTKQVDENARFLHTITKVKGFYLDEKTFKEKYSTSKYIENQNKIKLYEYPNKKEYCEIFEKNNNELLKFCKNEIYKIMCREKESHLINNDIVQENVFKHLLFILDEQIRDKHIRGANSFPTLEFENIHNVIMSEESYSQSSVEILREKFCDYWVEFLDEIPEEDEYPEEKIEEISEIIRKIYSLSEEEFVQFILDINPDKDKLNNLSSTSNVLDVCNVNAFKDIFYECLMAVTEQQYDITFKGYRNEVSNTSYLLTLIDRPKRKVCSVIEKMKRNEGITDYIFNRDYLINKSIDNVKFGQDTLIVSEKNNFKNNWNRYIDDKEKFYNPNLEFISVDNAIEKLNERVDYDG